MVCDYALVESDFTWLYMLAFDLAYTYVSSHRLIPSPAKDTKQCHACLSYISYVQIPKCVGGS